ncbi:mitochondrial-processing peptidase subunit alpha-like [Mercenaria mercenaria]|uniref:mitochondrial-processing peptidase subunit alpha-like n=1 Tax=Mercenaria mercenaria TaxID=6596 RepID=UPI00234F8BB3|nr:mitochondrial-processing peptidase subunit alpha-like [Mercenaria mercenaria]
MATRMLRNFLGQGCRKINRRCGRRNLSSSNEGGSSIESGINSVSLSSPPPNFPPPKYAVVDRKQHETQVTTLDNGMRVASENKFGEFSTVGVLIDSGSRYEVNYPSGINHFLEKLAFSKTTNYADRDKINQVLEKVGGICDCQSSRDTMIYAMSAETTGLPEVLDILSDVVFRPVIDDPEMEMARQTIGFELQSHKMNPIPDILVTEKIFAAGYRSNTLGLPKICPADNITKIDPNILYTYMNSFYDPKRIVLAGVGMDHDMLVSMAEKYFTPKSPIWTENKTVIDPSKGMDDSIAQYTGGLVTEEVDLSSVSLGPTPMPELAHLVIGLESCSHKDDDFVGYCVLNMLLGGGGSFSAGGPGKGMYTRLYLNVLNQHHWIESATAMNHAFEDTGLFVIQASSHPSKLGELAEVISHELAQTAGTIHDVELNRAKTQLQSMLMMNLEQRPVVFEDVGRQVLASGHRKQPEHYYDLIGKITSEDIHRVAERMLKTKPAVAGYGTLKKLPDLDNIQNMLLNKSKTKRRFSLFGR